MSVSINVNGYVNENINKSGNKNTLFMGNLLNGKDMTIQDRIAQKRQLYTKQANKMVKDADVLERKMDKVIQDCRDRARELMNQVQEYNEEMADIDSRIAQMQEECEIGPDSQEQKDLELLLKEQRSKNLRYPNREELTEEEQERLSQLGEPTEYQQWALEMYKIRDEDYIMAESAKFDASIETATARKLGIDRLEEHGMVDAQKAKEELMDAASKEIIGMVVQDAKDKIDEKAQEAKEEAEKLEEKKEEQEERVEAAKENRTEAEEQTEATKEKVEEMTKKMASSEELVADIQAEMKQIIEEQKLLLEEMKGMVVDKVV